MIIAVLLLIFSISVGFYIYIRVTYNKFKKYKLKSSMSGFEVARKILDNHDLNNVYITESKNKILSSYDINRKVIRLANGVFNDESLVSSCVSSIEAGHAILDKKKDKMYQTREKLVQFIYLLMIVGYVITLFGCFFGHINTIILGLSLIDLIIVYNFLFYSVEKKAMRISIVELVSSKIVNKNEYKKVGKLLKVTSFTTLASVIFPIAELIKKIILFGDSNR